VQSYNKDVHQPGAAQNPRIAITKEIPYYDAVVEDIILNETHPKYKSEGREVGFALLRLLPFNRNVKKNRLNWVPPLDSTIRDYPLIDETVLVFRSLGGMYYTRRVNTSNKITENKLIGIKEMYSGNSPKPSAGDVIIASKGGIFTNSEITNHGRDGNLRADGIFVENSLVKMLRHTEGDITVEGRYGNTIRFGSSLFSNPLTKQPQPNLLFSVGRTNIKYTSTETPSPHSLVFENIDTDKSSIWMVSDEEVKLAVATEDTRAHLRSAELSNANNYTGAQIFINSDRLIFNSKQNEISLFSAAEINLSSVHSITIDSAKSVMVSADNDITLTTSKDIVLSGSNIVFDAKEFSLETAGNYAISAKKIFIGSGGDESQPMVLGGELASWLQKLVQILATAQVITSTGPAIFAPQVITKLIDLGIDLGTPVSPQSAIFNSTSNFTSKNN
jgi:hypothetical protein